MRHLLKYLFPVLMTFAFCSVTGGCGFSHSDNAFFVKIADKQRFI